MDADLYVPGDGWLHRADPRVKFLITVVMLVLCLVWRNWAFILDVLIIEHLMLITDGVPLKRIGWVWKILAVIIVVVNLVLPGYVTGLCQGWGMNAGIAGTIASVVNTLLAVIVSYPLLKFWVMPKSKSKETAKSEEAAK